MCYEPVSSGTETRTHSKIVFDIVVLVLVDVEGVGTRRRQRVPAGPRDTGDNRQGRCRNISVFGTLSGAITKSMAGGVAPRPWSPFPPIVSFMSLHPSSIPGNLRILLHDAGARRDTEDSEDHYGDNCAWHPTASPPPDESVLRRAGWVFYSRFQCTCQTHILQSATDDGLLCVFSQFRPTPLAGRHTRKHGPTLKCRHAPVFPRPHPPAAPISHASPIFFDCPRHPGPSPAFFRTCVSLTLLRHRKRNPVHALPWHVSSFCVTIP